MQDKGYTDSLPIDAAIYLAVMEGKGIVEESYFTLMKMPASPRYSNAITYITNGMDEKVFLKLEVSVVVYCDWKGKPFRSEEFAYSLSCFCDLATQSIEQLCVS